MAKARPVTRPLTIGPTPERMAKGDVEQYAPRDFLDAKNRDLAPAYEVRQRRDNPLKMLAHLLSADEMAAAALFGRSYEKTQWSVPAINLNSAGGGRREGLTEIQCETLGAFGTLCRALDRDEEMRLRRTRLMVLVLGHRRTLSSLFPQKGRDFAAAKHMLISSIERLSRFLLSQGRDDANG